MPYYVTYLAFTIWKKKWYFRLDENSKEHYLNYSSENNLGECFYWNIEFFCSQNIIIFEYGKNWDVLEPLLFQHQKEMGHRSTTPHSKYTMKKIQQQESPVC